MRFVDRATLTTATQTILRVDHGGTRVKQWLGVSLHQVYQRLHTSEHFLQPELRIKQQSDLSVRQQVLEAAAQVARARASPSHQLRHQVQRHRHVEHPLNTCTAIHGTGIGMMTEFLALSATSQCLGAGRMHTKLATQYREVQMQSVDGGCQVSQCDAARQHREGERTNASRSGSDPEGKGAGLPHGRVVQLHVCQHLRDLLSHLARLSRLSWLTSELEQLREVVLVAATTWADA